MTPTSGIRASRDISERSIAFLAEAALDRKRVVGWTHNFYRYPARFSPRFAAAAIELFSRPGDVIVDPYMGGGTAIVEGAVAGRRAIGNDLNSLAAFVATVKTTPLTKPELAAVREWISRDVPNFGYRVRAEDLAEFIDPVKTRNLSLHRARFIKKAAAAGLASLDQLPSDNARNFARSALLRVAQWALDGRKTHTPLLAFRERLIDVSNEMVVAIEGFGDHMKTNAGSATVLNGDTGAIAATAAFQVTRASLVITSPPYPGVHVLYHRWQVDGRRETPAPYWITGCNDGQGASFYNFGDRREAAADDYFRTSLRTLNAIRAIMKEGAFIVQMLAFNNPENQLPRYLANMNEAGFVEVTAFARGRIWREVPSRKWHAAVRGPSASAREVVLVHQAL